MSRASIQAEIAALQAAVNAAVPFAAAPRAAVLALQSNARALVADVDTALAGAAGTLDAFPGDADPDLIVADVLAVVGSAADQSYFADLRGIVGRVASNLDQV